MDAYQPIYDAVRSRLSGGDINTAIQDAFRAASLDHYVMQAAESIRQAAASHERPSVLYRPLLARDGVQWKVVYGEVAGWGNSPDDAMWAFDAAWYRKVQS